MYDEIISHAPKDAQERIRTYADAVAHDVGDFKELLKPYGVESIKELVQHLVEFECGTRYLSNDPLIEDYQMFWSALS